MHFGVGEMTPSAKCLPNKQEEVSLTFITHIKMQDMMVHTCNPRVREQRHGNPWGFLSAKSTLKGEFQAKERPVSERGLDGISEDGTLGGTICLHTYTYATPHVYVHVDMGPWHKLCLLSPRTVDAMCQHLFFLCTILSHFLNLNSTPQGNL